MGLKAISPAGSQVNSIEGGSGNTGSDIPVCTTGGSSFGNYLHRFHSKVQGCEADPCCIEKIRTWDFGVLMFLAAVWITLHFSMAWIFISSTKTNMRPAVSLTSTKTASYRAMGPSKRDWNDTVVSSGLDFYVDRTQQNKTKSKHSVRSRPAS